MYESFPGLSLVACLQRGIQEASAALSSSQEPCLLHF